MALAHDQFIDRSLDLGAWEFVTPVPDDKPVPHLWAYRYKTGQDGSLEAVAARCTVRGDLMIAGEHFDGARTAAQSPSHTELRMLFARAALAGEAIRACDVPNAYLRAPADPAHRLTMQQPRLSDGTLTEPGKAVLVKRAQQGSPDGGYLWERHRNASLTAWGWKPLQSEPGCFIYNDPCGAFVDHAHAVATPIDPRADLSNRKPDELPLPAADALIYKRGVGIARFIVDTVIYDGAYAASQLARHLHNHCAHHMAALHRLAGYLDSKRNACLYYRPNAHRDDDANLTAYSDADYAACADTRRSRTGIAIAYAGDLVFWPSVLQKSVTLSTGEAEYMAASEAARVLVWLKQLANEWRIPITSPTKLFVDNAAALAMAVANGPTTRSKHIDTRARYIQEQVQNNRITTAFVPGNKQLADMFTKPLPLASLQRNLALIRCNGKAAAQS